MAHPAPAFFPGQKRAMKTQRDAAPLRTDELIELRKLMKLLKAAPWLEVDLTPAQVAALCGFKNKRVVLDRIRAGKDFPNAYHSAANVIRVPAMDVVAYKQARRIQPSEAVETPAFFSEEVES